MRLVVVCGYDGNECKKYKLTIDDDGLIKCPEPDCNLTECERCYFMGKPWVKIEMKGDKS